LANDNEFNLNRPPISLLPSSTGLGLDGMDLEPNALDDLSFFGDETDGFGLIDAGDIDSLGIMASL
jgi:hypothetical protein